MKVCFFSPIAYAYFRPRASLWAGGAETQQFLIGRYLAERGVEVSFIVADYGQPEIEFENGIKLIKSFTLFKGNRKLRFFADMLAIRRAMRIADADIYNQRSTAFYTGQLAWFARHLGKLFTFSVGSDYNIYPDAGGAIPRTMAALYRWGIKHADAVIAQTETQRRIMQANFKRDIQLIRNGIPIPETSFDASSIVPSPPEFLWVGTLRKMKRAELLIELARRVPEANFVLIGSKIGDESYSNSILQAIAKTSNIRHIDFVPPDEIDRFYSRACALVNTSSFEGFPNTFLHAWVHGTPVLTLEVDPDGTITREGLGLVGGTIEGLAACVRRMMVEENIRKEMGRRAREYVRKHHDIKDRGRDYLELFESLILKSKEHRKNRR